MRLSTRNALLILLTMLLAVGLTACGGGKDEPAAQQPEDDAANGAQVAAQPGDDPLYATAKYLLDNAVSSLIGVTSNGEDVVFIQTPDVAAVAFVSDEGKSISFVGAYEATSTQIAITDETSNTTFGMEIIQVFEDGSFVADMGDLGEIAFNGTDAQTAVTALLLINGLTEPIA